MIRHSRQTGSSHVSQKYFNTSRSWTVQSKGLCNFSWTSFCDCSSPKAITSCSLVIRVLRWAATHCEQRNSIHSMHREVALFCSSQFEQTTGLELLFATERKSNMLLMKKLVDSAPTPSLGTETSHRQVGQMMVFSPLLMSPCKQCWQKVCKQGRTLGIVYVSRQIGHFKRCSESFSTSTDAMFKINYPTELLRDYYKILSWKFNHCLIFPSDILRYHSW